MSSYLYDIGSTDLFKKTNTSTTSDIELQEKELSNDISRLIELKIEVTKLEKSIESRKSYLKTQQEISNQNQFKKFKESLEADGMQKVKELQKQPNTIIPPIEKIESIIQTGMNEFKKETGREMTYAEMRSMYG
jgi:hypothetical protein